jgi:hypothetical protein
MWTWLTPALDVWSGAYSNSGAIRTAVGFVHIGGLLVAGGAAIVADRGILSARRAEFHESGVRARQVLRTHRAVIAGLAAVILSGALLFGADADYLLHSRVFWIKSALVAALVLNGRVLTTLARRVVDGRAQSWPSLRIASLVSLTLWMLTTLLGAALPNV